MWQRGLRCTGPSEKLKSTQALVSEQLPVFAFPDTANLTKLDLLFSLEGLPANFVRPVRQKGWLMFDQPPIVPRLNEFWICSIPITCSTFSTDLTYDYSQVVEPPPPQTPPTQAAGADDTPSQIVAKRRRVQAACGEPVTFTEKGRISALKERFWAKWYAEDHKDLFFELTKRRSVLPL
jgi:hypothetical protein